jgi:hypothetical protein
MADTRQIPTDAVKLGLWQSFCDRHEIAGSAVPLFETQGGCVVTRAQGHDHRLILARSAAMEALVVREVRRVLAEGSRFEGVLYMMLWKGERGLVEPLYVGRAGRYGRGAGNVSANLKNIETDRGKFARWGSGYAYHIGDLSAAACPNHAPAKRVPKYARWAERLFVAVPEAQPKLRRDVYFWCTAWAPDSPSIWREFGATSLAFEEYLLIGVASLLFPATLLNTEGVNRLGPG